MDQAWTTVRQLADGVPLREALGGRDSAECWVALDLAVRWLSPEDLPVHAPRGGPSLRWDWNATLPTFRRARERAAEPEPATAIALCHPDGRIREAALDRVSRYPDLLPLLVVRCADWAAPVRDRARALLAEAPPAALVAQAELILLLGRRGQGVFAVELLGRALREGPAEALPPLLASADRATRRFAHRIAVERGLLPPLRLARIAARSGDVVLQDLCAEAALRQSDDKDVLDVLLAARPPRVRAAGVTALRRAGRFEEARAHLTDRSAVVRACARYVVRQGGTDPLPLYRALCTGESVAPGAAAGLGECGDRKEDAGTLWALVRHPDPAVRAQAVNGLRALDAVRRESLTPLLDDPSPAVVRAATRALLPHAAEFPGPWLRERDTPESPRAVRVAARRLLRAAGRPCAG
ncbi:HEAT repeat domain-containing protein [Streptomyces sp. NBC_00209]|uniref:HEAT repeat domain-containing protein n=1 Tax=Streptomyces sp. NBC_00209 TaxID=2975682 RepID=UPI0032520103